MPEPGSESFSVAAAAFTDPGKVRKHNEDYVAYHMPKEPQVRQSHGHLFVVCDGVGGGPAGEVASEHAVRRILNDYYQSPPAHESPLERLQSAIHAANLDIAHKNEELADGRHMTTTVVAAALVGSRLALAHVGDSRAYLVRGGQIAQLTEDHSWVAELVEAGDLTPEEAESHPWRNRITRALGMKETLRLDSQILDMQPDDRLVLCTDGLTRYVVDAEIRDVVSRQPARQAAQLLVHLANQRGGADNISVLVVDLAAPGSARAAAVGGPALRARPLWLMAVAGALLILIIAAIIFVASRYVGREPEASLTTIAPAASIATETSLPALGERTQSPDITPTATPTTTPSNTPAPPTSTIRPTEPATPRPASPTGAPAMAESPTAPRADQVGAPTATPRPRLLPTLLARSPTPGATRGPLGPPPPSPIIIPTP